ncbi:siderophore-iron reductase FhuF [Variovorax sp. IB41]|uniref:siderophore-iron reductase FhuF n=1 Tax=Variovorax sp. IB41 TaxID=2779370 RepID=UPI0018E8B6D5|nr:siderophore-iron reductase FhuF [Variovorax sp. IB41]MBJ2159732.1 siderophore-iron reductase FhuF [Variovorax sp. IB41]
MIPILEPLFEGEDLRPFGERLQCAPVAPAGAVRVADLLAPDALMAVMRRSARFRRSDGRDLRPIASAWSLEYLAALLPPVIAAATVLEQVFPIGADETWVVLDDDGNPVRFHILHMGAPMPGAPTSVRYAPLLWQHLAPLFETLARLTRLAPKILWGNAAREFDVVFEQALALTGLPAIAEDWARLVRDPVWPSRHCGGEPMPERGFDNPLHGRQREVRMFHDDHYDTVKLHRQCCLYHLLPGEDYCGACPLAPAHREIETETETETPGA